MATRRRAGQLRFNRWTLFVLYLFFALSSQPEFSGSWRLTRHSQAFFVSWLATYILNRQHHLDSHNTISGPPPKPKSYKARSECVNTEVFIFPEVHRENNNGVQKSWHGRSEHAASQSMRNLKRKSRHFLRCVDYWVPVYVNLSSPWKSGSTRSFLVAATMKQT